MLVNPEIRRNLWLEFSLHRLLAMPIVLGLIFFITYHFNENPAANIASIALVINFVVIKLWGGYKAAGAVIEEVNDHTWDSQKLSALSPWSLTLGKLIGSTLYNWYGGLMAFAAFAVAEYYILPVDEMIPNAILFLLSGLIVHATALLSSMASMQGATGARQKLKSIFHLIIGLVIGGLFIPRVRPEKLLLNQPPPQSNMPLLPDVVWYGEKYNLNLFVMVTGLLVLGWLVSNIYWQMRTQMKMRAGPWLWIGFIVFWIVYYSGFNIPPQIFERLAPNFPIHRLVTFGVAFIGLYFIAFEEPWSGVSYRRFFNAWANGNYWKLCELCPCWVLTYPLCIIGAVVSYIKATTAAPDPTSSMLLPSSLFSAALVPPALLLSSLLCFAVRDIALLHFFKLSPSNRRPKLSAAFYMALLYILLPFMLNVFHVKEAAAAFIPEPGYLVTTIVSAAIQALIMVPLAYNQWRRHWTRYE